MSSPTESWKSTAEAGLIASRQKNRELECEIHRLLTPLWELAIISQYCLILAEEVFFEETEAYGSYCKRH